VDDKNSSAAMALLSSRTLRMYPSSEDSDSNAFAAFFCSKSSSSVQQARHQPNEKLKLKNRQHTVSTRHINGWNICFNTREVSMESAERDAVPANAWATITGTTPSFTRRIRVCLFAQSVQMALMAHDL
jgi:hypothetical protein